MKTLITLALLSFALRADTLNDWEIQIADNIEHLTYDFGPASYQAAEVEEGVLFGDDLLAAELGAVIPYTYGAPFQEAAQCPPMPVVGGAPEPGTWWLLGAGLLLCGVLKVRAAGRSFRHWWEARR
jgi:hypothetical protein